MVLELNESQTYYGLELMTNDWIIKRLYISKPQISFKEYVTIIQLNFPQEMKKEILIKTRIENIIEKIYLMIITLDLNILENDTEKAYHQKEDLSGIFYYKLNKIEIPTYDDNRIENIDYDNNGDFGNLDN